MTRRPPPLHAGLAGSLWFGALAALPAARAGLAPWDRTLAAEGARIADRLAAVEPEELARAVGAEAGTRLAQFLAGVERYRAHPRRRAAGGRAELGRWGAVALREHYPRPGAGRPVLLVPSLVNRARILDLAPGRSLTRVLAERGLRPLVVDWGEPGEEERAFSLGDYVARRLEPALEAACAAAGGPVAAVGYCMGGLLALALALRRPDRVSALALLAAPWDFHAGDGGAGALARAAEPWLAPAISRLGVLPAEGLQALFALAQPARIAAKFRAFAALPPEDPAAAAFVEVEDWLDDGVPLAGPAALECLFDWYGRNATANGRWRVAGEVVDPAAAAFPALVFVPERDRLVPPDSAAALAAALPGARSLRPRTGHIGMVVGRRARADCAEPLAEWLLAAGNSARPARRRAMMRANGGAREERT